MFQRSRTRTRGRAGRKRRIETEIYIYIDREREIKSERVSEKAEKAGWREEGGDQVRFEGNSL